MDETLTQMDSFFKDVNKAVTKSCANHHLGPRGRLTKINSLQAFFPRPVSLIFEENEFEAWKYFTSLQNEKERIKMAFFSFLTSQESL